jgi:hypothetical protein
MDYIDVAKYDSTAQPIGYPSHSYSLKENIYGQVDPGYAVTGAVEAPNDRGDAVGGQAM